MNYIEEVRKLNSDRTYKALINTYGCQQNENDSEKIAGLLQEMGYGFTESETDADLIIFNTCAIRENAEKKFYGSLGAIKILKEMRPNMIIAVSGCMTGQEHVVKRIKSTYKQVDVVLSANNYKKLPELIYNARAKHDRFFDTTYEDKVPEEGIPVLRTDKIKIGTGHQTGDDTAGTGFQQAVRSNDDIRYFDCHFRFPLFKLEKFMQSV